MQAMSDKERLAIKRIVRAVVGLVIDIGDAITDPRASAEDRAYRSADNLVDVIATRRERTGLKRGGR